MKISYDLILSIIDLLTITKKLKILLKIRYLNKNVYNYIHYHKKIQICCIKKYITKNKILWYKKSFHYAMLSLINLNPKTSLLIKDYNFNIGNVRTPFYINEEYNNNFIRRDSDIISSFIVIGESITKIELMDQAKIIAHNYYLSSSLASFMPFKIGIQMTGLAFSQLRIKVYAKSIKKIYSVNYLLDGESRRVQCTSNTIVEHPFIDFKNKKLLSKLIYEPGYITLS